MKKIILDSIPKKTNNYDWKRSLGYLVPFIYNNIKGIIKILDYYRKNKKGYLKIEYNNNIYFLSVLKFKKCEFGELFGLINHQYKYNINDIIKQPCSTIKILRQIRIFRYKDKNDTTKGYEYVCLNCGNVDIISEVDLGKKCGCPICSNHKIKIGINDMKTTNPNLASMLANSEDGYKYTEHSGQKVNWKCPTCGNIIKNKSICQINKHGLSCSQCGDGISYPNKFLFNLLNQLLCNKFENEKIFNWAKDKRYDFYFKINNNEYIIEAQGLQHYQETHIGRGKGRVLVKEQENDRLKKELALQNGINKENYIVIDCRESNLEWIKQHILKSKLSEIFNLSKIDWLKCHEYACNSLIKKICELWNSDIHSAKKISEIMKLSKTTIIKYLKRGNQLNWCIYDPKKESKKNNKKCTYNRKKIICINNKEIFSSIKKASDYYHIQCSNIGMCCQGKRKSSGKDLKTGEKLHWMYYKNYLELTNDLANQIV